MNNLNKDLKEYLLKQGASVVGFADLNELPLSDRYGYKYGVQIMPGLLEHLNPMSNAESIEP